LRPFILVGRIAGVPEQEIQQRWSSGEREQVIRRAQALAAPFAPAKQGKK
jgi:hypothetical protein